MAGHLGHVVIVAGGRACTWGGHGCVEANASGPALAREFARRAGRGRLEAWFGVSPPEVTVEHIVRCLASKEADHHPFAEGAIDRAGGLLGLALGGLPNALLEWLLPRPGPLRRG